MGQIFEKNVFGECHLTEAQAGYIAGLIDGEGTITVYTRRGEGRKSHEMTVKVTVANTRLEMLYWLIGTTGNGYISKASENGIHKTLYTWMLCPEQIRVLLPLILPYLVIKRRQAELVLRILAIRSDFKAEHRYCYSDAEIEEIFAIHQEIRQLNQRGNSVERYAIEPAVREAQPAKGEGNASHKLTETQAAEIATLYATGQYSQRELAARFGVKHPTIGRILRGQDWKHVEKTDATAALEGRTHGELRVRPTLRGEGNTKSKLTEAQVREIRALYATDQFSKAELGRRFGMDHITIAQIVTGKTWKHLDDAPKSEQPNPTRICNVCEKSFEATDVRMRSCSRKCCLRYQKVKIKQRAQEAALPLE